MLMTVAFWGSLSRHRPADSSTPSHHGPVVAFVPGALHGGPLRSAAAVSKSTLQRQNSQQRLARAAVKARLVADIQMNTETAVGSEVAQIEKEGSEEAQIGKDNSEEPKLENKEGSEEAQVEKEGIKAPPGVFPPRTKQDMLKQ